MKKGKIVFSIIILGIILFNLSIITVIASDEDSDGIDDKYESVNKRSITIELSDDQIEVQSILRTGVQKDSIRFRIRNDSDGLEIELQYSPEYEGGEQEHVELEFSIALQKLIEYVDLDGNNIYDESIDQTIQELEIKEFKPLIYSQIPISPDTTLHYFKLSTKDGTFITHIYFSEEFTKINDSLITPSQARIDIEINNFNYAHASSQLALYVELESDSDYQEKDETEDEELGYAEDESSTYTRSNFFTGFFSWKEYATIDDVLKNILVSQIEDDDIEPNQQKIYLNYPRGTNIYHDPKLGIEGILKSLLRPGFPLDLTIIIIIIISAISISVAYSMYHYRERIFSSIILANQGKKELKKSKIIDSGPNEIEKELHNPLLTAISADFLKELKLLDLEKDEKEQFIKDMLALSPFERRLILKEMRKKSKFKD